MAVLVALLVFGPRWGLATLGSFVLLFLALGGAIHLGWMAGPPPDGASMAEPVAWVREVIGFGGFGGVLLVSVGYVLQRTTKALHDLQKEQAEHEEAEEALRESDRKVQELQRVEALGRLAGGVAHDFNDSLVVMLAGLELLDQEPVSPDAREAMGDMRHAVQGAGQLVRQLLAYGRRDVVAPEHLSLRQLLDQEVRGLRRVMPDDVLLELELEDPPDEWVDRAQLHHAVLNLVLNARDALPSGGSIRVSARGEGALAAIAVSDNGTGMTDEVRQRVLEPFYTTKPQGQGTGLGLSMVASVVQGWGGTLSIESAPGDGTTVRFTLPRSQRAPAPQPTRPAAAPGTGRILLVEDEPSVRRTMAMSLRKQGYTVVDAADGDEALAHLDAPDEPFDLLCTDGIMPGAPVRAVLARYRSQHAHGRVLICSGYLEEELIRRDIASGGAAFLAKPFSGAELADKVAAVLACPAGAGDA